MGWVPPDPDGSLCCLSQSPDHAQSPSRGLAPLFPPRSAKSPRCRALRAVPCALRVPPLTPLLFPQTRAARTSPSPWWQKDWPPAGKGSEPTSTYVAVPPAPGSGSAPRGSAVGSRQRGTPRAGCTGLSLGAVALSRSCWELVAPEGSQFGAGRSLAVPTVPAAPRGPLLEGCCAGAINTGGTLFPSCACWAGSSPVSLPKTVPGTLGCFPCSVFSRTACKQVHGVNSVRCQGQGRGALRPGSPLQDPQTLSGPAPCLSGDTVPVPVPSHPLTPS